MYALGLDKSSFIYLHSLALLQVRKGKCEELLGSGPGWAANTWCTEDTREAVQRGVKGSVKGQSFLYHMFHAPVFKTKYMVISLCKIWF